MTGGSYTIRGGHWWQRNWACILGRLTWGLVIMCALFGLAAGINWLSHQPWSSGRGGDFYCDSGQTLIWKQVARHGNTWTLARSSNSNDLVLICKG